MLVPFATIVVGIKTSTLQAQDFGADVVSSYVWRGTQFGSGAHIQPWMELGSGSLTGGVWGSFPTTASGGGNELDLWVSYDFGPFALNFDKLHFPNQQWFVRMMLKGCSTWTCLIVIGWRFLDQLV